MHWGLEVQSVSREHDMESVSLLTWAIFRLGRFVG